MTHLTRMTRCDSSVPTIGHSFFEALLPLVSFYLRPQPKTILPQVPDAGDVPAVHLAARGGKAGGAGAGLWQSPVRQFVPRPQHGAARDRRAHRLPRQGPQPVGATVWHTDCTNNSITCLM